MGRILFKLYRLVTAVLVLLHLGSACVNDAIWDLITCGYKAKLHLDKNTQTEICSPLNYYNRDRIVTRFTECTSSYYYDLCSDEQKEGYVIDRFQEALNAIPCAITTTAGCVANTMDCIIKSAKNVAKQTTQGLPCFCNYRTALLNEFNACLSTPEADLNAASCAASNSEQTTLQEGINRLKSALADKACSTVDINKCTCWETVHDCIYGPSTNMGGEFEYFLDHQWSLIEVAALQDSNVKLETTRAWRKYDQCRTDGYPDQYARAVMCLEANVTSHCDIAFPMTVAFAEHFSNTTFYQTAAAALKNVEQFCSVWCRNATLWTGQMVNCLSSFHPSNAEVDRSSIISYILNSTDAELKDTCNSVKALPNNQLDKQLNCSADAIDRCFYLPYHLIIAAEYQFERTLTASDAMEALYRILLACDIDIKTWAGQVIKGGIEKSTNYRGGGRDGLISFFGGASTIYKSLELKILTVTTTSLAVLTTFNKPYLP